MNLRRYLKLKRNGAVIESPVSFIARIRRAAKKSARRVKPG